MKLKYSYNKLSLNLVTFIVLMITSGCKSNTIPLTAHPVPATTGEKIPSSGMGPESQDKIAPDEHISHLTQCNRDLESLRTVSMTEYRRYQSEYDALMKSSAGFMTVRDDVSPEVAELARPKFQFALVNLCYRIKDALAQTLINQAGGH